MIKNGLFGYGRLLLTVVFVSMVVLLSGCCTFCNLEKSCPEAGFINPGDCPVGQSGEPSCLNCNMEVIYAFDIPESDADCKVVTNPNNPGATVQWVFVDLKAEEDERDGGGGIIDRDGGFGVIERDGGGGIIDRSSGESVMKFCDYSPCDPNTQIIVHPPRVLIDLEKSHTTGVVAAKNECRQKVTVE